MTNMALVPNHIQDMLLTLGNDLKVNGWSQGGKIYAVQGDPGDEYVNFLASTEEDIFHYLAVHMIEHSVPDVRGLLVCVEMWTVDNDPNDLTDQENESYQRLLPAAEHEDRVDARALILLMSDGKYLELVQTENGLTEWSTDPQALGIEDTNLLVNYMNQWLQVEPDGSARFMPTYSSIIRILDLSAKQCWTQNQLMATILNLIPKKDRSKWAQKVPSEILRQIRI